MKPLSFKCTATISLSILLISSLFVIARGNAYASAQEPVNTSGSDDDSASSGFNRFVVWSDTTPGNFEIFFRRSTDNGATWQPVVNLSNNPGRSFDEKIAVSGSNVYVAWAQANAQGTELNIFFRRSTDNGATWKPIVKITSSATIQFSEPEIATSANNIYVIMASGSGAVYFRASADNGATWLPTVNFDPEFRSPLFHRLAASGSNVYILWVSTAGRGDVMLERSTDNGASWEPPVNVSNNALESTEPQIAVSGSRLYVVWAQEQMIGSAAHDTFFRRSTDAGATWKPARNLSNNAGQSFDQQIAVSGSNVYVVWIDDTPGNHEIFFRRSTDNGATWRSTINLSKNAADSLQPIIAKSGSDVHVVWSNRIPGNWELYVRSSTDKGVTWKPFVNLSNNPGDSGNPNNAAFVKGSAISASGSNLHVVWQDSTGGDYDILTRRSTDSGVAWKSVKNLSNNSGDSIDPQIAR